MIPSNVKATTVALDTESPTLFPRVLGIGPASLRSALWAGPSFTPTVTSEPMSYDLQKTSSNDHRLIRFAASILGLSVSQERSPTVILVETRQVRLTLILPTAAYLWLDKHWSSRIMVNTNLTIFVPKAQLVAVPQRRNTEYCCDTLVTGERRVRRRGPAPPTAGSPHRVGNTLALVSSSTRSRLGRHPRSRIHA